MRRTVFFLSALLILWITGASYWYVCRIRGDCRGNLSAETETTPGDDATKAAISAGQALQASIEEAKTYLANSGLQKVYFESSSGTSGMEVIPAGYFEKLKLYLDNNPDVKVEVSGHTDSSGPKSVNVRLSLERTEFVKNFLVNSGINANQILTSSKVDTEPAASNDTPEGRAKNRRTEIKIIN